MKSRLPLYCRIPDLLRLFSPTLPFSQVIRKIDA